jgi:transcriptional regulator with XRE-family HTH domain
VSVQTGRLRVVAPETPEESPEALGDVPSPGGYIREQRKRRGMSLEQLAAATKIPRESIALLEDDRYEALPGTVFVKGFLRCCARSLGVNPETVMELLYERERAALQARRRSYSDVHAASPPPEPTVTTNGPAEPPALGRTRPPRLARPTTPPTEHPIAMLIARLPSANAVLWIVVGLLVAMVVLAAFNLMGSGPHPGGQS